MYHLPCDLENHDILQNKAKHHGKTLFRAKWPGSFTLKLNALFETRYFRGGGEVPRTARPWCLSWVSTRRYVPFRFPSIFLGNRRTIDIMDKINDAFIGNICCRKLGGRIICVYVIDYETKHEMNTIKIFIIIQFTYSSNQFLWSKYTQYALAPHTSHNHERSNLTWFHELIF